MVKENNNLEVENTDSKEEEKSEFEKLYQESIKSFKNGEIVKGKIVNITPKEVVVDIGYKSEGAISLTEFSDPDALKIGDEIEVYLESKEDENGMVVPEDAMLDVDLFKLHSRANKGIFATIKHYRNNGEYLIVNPVELSFLRKATNGLLLRYLVIEADILLRYDVGEFLHRIFRVYTSNGFNLTVV